MDDETISGGSPEVEFVRRAIPVGQPRRPRSRAFGTWLLALVCALAASQSGCSLFVMAGKMLFGDPKVDCSFKKATKTDLSKEGRRILVVCSSPDSIKDEFPSVDYDLLDGVTRRLKTHGIKVVNPDEVATYLDDHGGRWEDVGDMGEHFNADFVVHIDLTRFTCREENSPSLLRGQAEGRVHAYRIADSPAGQQTSEVMDQEFVSTHPSGYPVSIDKKSAKVFNREYIDRVCTQLAQLFYDHPLSEEID
ncbi:MAG: hypothetical protein AB7O26_02505 [Planctomycetaceae bacterium]